MSRQVRRLLAGEVASVVFLDPAEITELIAGVVGARGRVAELPAPATKVALLGGIGEGLRYPDWWGHNWDALGELLSFPEPAGGASPLPVDVPEAIVWHDPARLAAADPAAWETAVEIFEDAIEDRRSRGAAPLMVVLAGRLPADEAWTPNLVPASARAAGPRKRAPQARVAPESARAVAPLPEAVRSVGRVHHIAVIVREMDAALRFWRDTLGLAPGPVVPIPSDRVNIAFLPVGEVKIELVEPTDDSTGVARFLEKKGEGVHHVCFEVPDIAAALGRMAARGIELIDQAARPGAEGPVAFLHPRSCHGVLVELIEAEGGPAWPALYPDGFRAPGAPA